MASRIVLGGLVVAIALASGPVGAARLETERADPPPSLDAPRRVLFGLNTRDDGRVNNLLYNVVNVQKAYGMDNVEIVVLAWGPGVRALLSESSTVAERISSLRRYDVTFIACGNTLDTLRKTEADLLPGVDIVQAGLPELIERRLRGWIDIIP